VSRLAFLVALSIAPFAGCAKPEPMQRPPVEVSTSQPVIREVYNYFEISGRSEASAVFEARARVSGTLMPAPDGQSRFTEGDHISAMTELFLIEPAPYQAAQDAAKARVDSAQAELNLADANYKRFQALFEKNAITQAELDKEKADFDVKKAALAREKAALKKADIDLEYTQVVSPIDGIVGEMLVDEGNIVGVGEFTLLTTVRQIDPLKIYFDIPEKGVLKFLREIAEGNEKNLTDYQLKIQFEGETGYPHEGTIELIDNQIDPNTGTALLRGVMENKEAKILPGAYAQLLIRDTAIPDAVLVSEIAINTDLSGKYLLVVNEDDQVEQRRVRLGQLYNGFRHITAMWSAGEPEPIEDGDVPTDFHYIHAGLLQARPGIKVKAMDVPLEYSETGAAEKKMSAEETEDTDAESPDSGPPEEE